jgi:glutathione synthase/RimK-type ligase-like ATP-grasp enzyme
MADAGTSQACYHDFSGGTLMQQIGFATYRNMPQGADDDLLVADALRSFGFDVVPVIWDASEPLRAVPPAVVIRSCWKYHLHPRAFLQWVAHLEAQGTRVFNPSPLVTWNIDKHYLNDLASHGVALPQTVWVERGAQTDLAGLLSEHGMDAAVIKPAISLSAYKTWRTSLAEARAHQQAFDELVREQSVIVQSYIEAITSSGELSLVFFGRTYSHAVRKWPKAGDFRVQVDYGGTRAPVAPPLHVLEQAQAIVDLVHEPLLYARVDGIDTGAQFILMELELIDPVLFFAYDQQAPQRFAEALIGALEPTDTGQ